MKLEFISARQSLRESGYLLTCLLASVVCAAVVSAFPIYGDAVEGLGVRRMADSLPPSATGAWVRAPEIAFNPAAIAATNNTLDEAGDMLGDLTHAKTVFVRSGSLLAQTVDADAPIPPRSWHYQSIASNLPGINYVAGAPPASGETVEVGLSASVAATLGIKVGDQFELTIPPTDIVHSIATVSGTWQPIDESGEYWQGLYRSLMEPEQGQAGGTPPVIAIVSIATLTRLAADSIADLGEVWAVYYTDPDVLRGIEIGATVDTLERFRNHIANELPDSRVVSGIQSALETLRRQLAFANVSTRVASSLFAAYLVFVIFALARMVTKLRDRDRAGLAARGAGRGQVAKTFLLHGAILSAIPAIAGPLISASLLPLLGRTAGFTQITGGQPLGWSLTLEQFAYSIALSVAVALYFFLPAVVSTARPLLTAASRGLTTSRLWVWRANVDLLLIVAALALIYEANSRGALVGSDGTVAGVSVLLPVAAATAVALIALRAMPLVGALFNFLGRIQWFPNLATTATIFARSILTHATPMLVAAGAMVVALTSLGLQDTLSRNTEDRAAYDAIADVRLSGIDGYERELNRDVQRIQDLSWIGQTAWGIRGFGQAGTTEAALGFELMAVQPKRFGELAWFRSDFAARDITELMGAISQYAKPDGLTVPDHASSIFLDAELVQLGAGSGRIDLWIRIADATGRTHTLQMEADGTARAEMPKRWTSAINADIQRPLTVLGIEVYEPPVSPLGNLAELTIYGVGVRTRNGSEIIMSDPTDASHWHPMSSAPAGSTTIEVRRDSFVVSMESGNDDGIRGIYYSSRGPIEVPILVNQAFIEESGLAVGDSFTGQSLGRYVPFTIRATYNLWPSFPDPGRPSAVVNVNALLDYIAPVSEPFLGNSAEVIATVLRTTTPDTRRADIKAIDPAISVFDREAIVANSSGALASITGWRYIGRVVTILATAIGALTLFAFGVRLINDAQRNYAILESIGSARIANLMDRVFSLGFPVLIGLTAIGLSSGFYGVQWFAQNMITTEGGAATVPPLAMQVDWPAVAIVATVILASAVLPASLDISRRRVPLAARIRSESSA